MSVERVRGGAHEAQIFRSPERANEFQESFEQRIRAESKKGTSREREIMAEQLAKIFEEEGVGVDRIKEPWSHTKEEHAEAQVLVEMAFTHGLSTALKQAHSSEHFPRNVDLLHDVLTGRLYDAVVADRVNVHHPSPTVLASLLALFFGMIIVVVVFVYSL